MWLGDAAGLGDMSHNLWTIFSAAPGWSTGSPNVSAAILTAGAASFRPRPAGRSGCVTTETTSHRRAVASRQGTANSGDPMNAADRRDMREI